MLTAAQYDRIGHQTSRVSGKQVAPRQGDLTQNQKGQLTEVFVCLCVFLVKCCSVSISFHVNGASTLLMLHPWCSLGTASLSYLIPPPRPLLLSIYCFVCSGESWFAHPPTNQASLASRQVQRSNNAELHILYEGRWRDTGRSDAAEATGMWRCLSSSLQLFDIVEQC